MAGKAGQIIKNVYFAEIDKLLDQAHYYETEGPVLLEQLSANIKSNEQFSFMMKDEVLVRSLDFIEKKFLNKVTSQD